MKIVPGVSYHPFDDKVYVHSSDTQKDYIFSGITFDILDYFAKYGDASIESLYDWLVEQYDVDKLELQNDIQKFIPELIEEKILYEDEYPHFEEQWSNQIPMEVAASFAKEHKLFSITLELTYRCVEKCIHCYIDDAPKFCAKDELTLNEYKNILKQARELGCVNVLFTGGEVLLRPDLCDIVEYAVNLGFIVNIYTTGVGLTDKVFDRLCAAKINGISVSLYSGIAAEHDKITGVKGSFEKTLKAALMFKAAGVNTFIKCVAMKQNFDSLESLYELGKRIDIHISTVTRVVSGHNGKCAADYSLESLELYKKFYELSFKYYPVTLREEKYPREQMLEIKTCGAGLSSLSIDPFGGVHACLSFPKAFGSVCEDNLKNLWELAKNLNFRNRKLRDVTPQCETCKYIENCQVCVAALILDKGESFCDCGEEILRAEALTATIK